VGLDDLFKRLKEFFFGGRSGKWQDRVCVELKINVEVVETQVEILETHIGG
jgi:hypothetical protein